MLHRNESSELALGRREYHPMSRLRELTLLNYSLKPMLTVRVRDAPELFSLVSK